MVSLLFTVRLSEPIDAANILINYSPLDRGPLGQVKKNMYERLLFHTAKRMGLWVVSFTQRQINITQRKRSSGIKNYSGLVLKTLG